MGNGDRRLNNIYNRQAGKVDLQSFYLSKVLLFTPILDAFGIKCGHVHKKKHVKACKVSIKVTFGAENQRQTGEYPNHI